MYVVYLEIQMLNIKVKCLELEDAPWLLVKLLSKTKISFETLIMENKINADDNFRFFGQKLYQTRMYRTRPIVTRS